MKKFKSWTEKSITWGGYLKLCGVCYVITIVIVLVECAARFNIPERILRKFRKNEDDSSMIEVFDD